MTNPELGSMYGRRRSARAFALGLVWLGAACGGRSVTTVDSGDPRVTTAGANGVFSAGGTSSTGGTMVRPSPPPPPLCNDSITRAGVVPTKGGACAATDPQSCYRTCGPESTGFKSETCVGGAYVEGVCAFPADADFSCFKIPAMLDPACPTSVPQAGQLCDVQACTPCNAGGAYLDSTGAAKIGYCLCVPATVAAGAKWSCATTSNWPCPSGQGC